MGFLDGVRAVFGKQGREVTGVPVSAPSPAPAPDAQLDLRAELSRVILDSIAKTGKGYVSTPDTLFGATTPDGKRKGVLSFDVMRRMYDQSSLIRAVVDTKMRQITGLDWAIVKSKRNKDRFAPIGAINAATDLFERPNEDNEDWTTFSTKFLTDLFVLDAAAIEVVGPLLGNGKPMELVALDAATIIPKVDDRGHLIGYEQRVKDATGTDKPPVQFGVTEIAYIRCYPRTTTVWGHSPLESLIIDISTDIYVMSHNASQFTEGMLAKVILVLLGGGQKAVEDLRAHFNEHKGDSNLLPIIDIPVDKPGAGAQLLKLVENNRDMEMMALELWILKRVCAVYQVDVNQVLLIESIATKATEEGQQAIHHAKGLIPDLKNIAGTLTRCIVSRFHPVLTFSFVEADRLDETEEAAVVESQVRGGRPLNEVREERGLDPLEDGPFVTIEGQRVCIFDLPCNPSTGLPWGYELTDEGGASADPFGSNPFDPNAPTEGGDPAGTKLPPWKRPKAMKAASGRRQPCPSCAHKSRSRVEEGPQTGPLAEALAATGIRPAGRGNAARPGSHVGEQAAGSHEGPDGR